MVLTQSQENIIKQYLSEVNTAINSECDLETRKKLLIELRKKILAFIQKKNKNYIRDEELVEILYEEFGEPELQAEKLTHPIDFTIKLTLDFENRIWLGVCSGLAQRIKIPVWLVRFFFSILGLCGGIVFVLYLCIYFSLYLTSKAYRGKNIKWFFLLYQFLLTIFLLMIVYLFAMFILWGLEYIHVKWVSDYGSSLSGVKEAYRFAFLFFLLFTWTGVLSAIMGGLPLRNGWDKTFRNIRDAQIALLVLFESGIMAFVLYHFIVEAVIVLRNLMI